MDAMIERFNLTIRTHTSLPVEQQCLDVMIRVTEATFERFALKKPLVHIVVLNDPQIHSMNLQWRGIDHSTDVLSFAAHEGSELVTAGQRDFLGDIAISIDRASQQAQQFGHSLQRELAFLTVHGLLHLLGYDHINDEEQKEMFSLQEEILSAVGLVRT